MIASSRARPRPRRGRRTCRRGRPRALLRSAAIAIATARNAGTRGGNAEPVAKDDDRCRTEREQEPGERPGAGARGAGRNDPPGGRPAGARRRRARRQRVVGQAPEAVGEIGQPGTPSSRLRTPRERHRSFACDAITAPPADENPRPDNWSELAMIASRDRSAVRRHPPAGRRPARPGRGGAAAAARARRRADQAGRQPRAAGGDRGMGGGLAGPREAGGDAPARRRLRRQSRHRGARRLGLPAGGHAGRWWRTSPPAAPPSTRSATPTDSA